MHIIKSQLRNKYVKNRLEIFCVYSMKLVFFENFKVKYCILVNKVCPKLNTVSNDSQSTPTKHQYNLSKQL